MKKFSKKAKGRIALDMMNIYDEHGQSGVFDAVNKYNANGEAQIPFEDCKGCETESPSLDHCCLVCGQGTTIVDNSPKFYQAVLKPIKDVMKHVYPTKHHLMTLEDRMGNCGCENCGRREWILLPKECIAVRESGKQYIECMNCGNVNHL